MLIEKGHPPGGVIKGENTMLLGGGRQLVEFDFSGASVGHVIKFEQTDDADASSATWTVFEKHTLTATSGTIHSMLSSVSKKIKHFRAKGYDTDGSTALSDSTSQHPVVIQKDTEISGGFGGGHTHGIPPTTKKGTEPIYDEASRVVKELVRTSTVSHKIIDFLDIKQQTWLALAATIAAIEANDATDITEYTISGANDTLYGLDQYPEGIRKQITENKNWVINGTNLSTPHYILGDKIYTFKDTGGDDGGAVAKACEEVFVCKLAKTMTDSAKGTYPFGHSNHAKLLAAGEILDAIADEKIDLI